MQVVRVTPRDEGLAMRRYGGRDSGPTELYADLVSMIRDHGYGVVSVCSRPRCSRPHRFGWRWGQLDAFAARYNLEVSEPLRCVHCNTNLRVIWIICLDSGKQPQACCGCAHV